MKKKLISIGLVGLLLGGCTTVAQEQSEEEVVTEVASSETNQLRPSTDGVPVSAVSIEMCGAKPSSPSRQDCTGLVYYIWGEVTEDDVETLRLVKRGLREDQKTAYTNIILIKDTDGCLANSPFGIRPGSTILAMNQMHDSSSQTTISINAEVLDEEAREEQIDSIQSKFRRGDIYATCPDWERIREGYETNYEPI
ncbi:hypothetical protein A5482_014710 (plasmid) [Cyanobacterium sp. IPPAS B-1200]|uniref:hypothetical protein n=1 Tax=Cyanobacterium sp. IPPAS B-1200 TaxID=1562720 RepID=UPI0008526F2E|nr:hypothetical protein [Cyanobacterium sp. IPPAS B-1200]OEJ78147.1 hypothetical protein A5482_14010 [Cyanobacterium sp. IPPAS B-1200]